MFKLPQLDAFALSQETDRFFVIAPMAGSTDDVLNEVLIDQGRRPSIMRPLNVIGIALTASAAVAIAFGSKASLGAERDRMWLESLRQPVKEMMIHRRRDGMIEEAAKYSGRDGAIGVLRDPGHALPATKTLAARDAAAFERELKRRFHSESRTVIAYMPPAPLPAEGRMVSGFVTRVDAGGKTCDFAVAGYSDSPGQTDIVAVARVMLCDGDTQLSSPDIRLSPLLAQSERQD